MKLASLIAAALAALIVAVTFTQPAEACGWRRSAYYGGAADVGPVRGYRYYRPYSFYRPVVGVGWGRGWGWRRGWRGRW